MISEIKKHTHAANLLFLNYKKNTHINGQVKRYSVWQQNIFSTEHH